MLTVEEAAAGLVSVTQKSTGTRHVIQDWIRKEIPLALAGQLVQEDFCILRKKEPEGQYCFVAGAACFAFDKVGLRGQNGYMKLGEPLNYIHTAVPGFTQMSTSVDSFFDQLKPEGPKWRSNWFLAGGHSDGTYHLSRFESEILDPQKKG